MIATAIPGTVVVYSIHEPGQRPVDGLMVYEYPVHWKCEDGLHRAWVKGSPLAPCEHVQMALALEAKQRE